MGETLVVLGSFMVLVLIIYFKDRKITKLEQDNRDANLAKELEGERKKASDSEKAYKDSKSDYDKFKSEHPELF
jgi:hypothetical protein